MAKSENFNVEPLKRGHLRVSIIGDSPLICNRFTPKTANKILAKQQKKSGKALEAKDPEQRFNDSLYPHPEGGYGFPTIAFKKAAVRAANDAGMTMTSTRRAFHVVGELVKIEGEPEMRMDRVSIGRGKTDIRIRGYFPKWRTELTITYNANVISNEELLELLQLAGFGVGVGEWRPQNDGNYGMFHIATEGE